MERSAFDRPNIFLLFFFLFLFFINKFARKLVSLFSTSLSLAGTSGRLTWVRRSSRKSGATCSCRRVRCYLVSAQWCGCQCLGFLTCTQMLMCATAGVLTDVVTESALETDSGRKIPCRTGDSHPRQCYSWFFSQMHYQLSYSCLFMKIQNICVSKTPLKASAKTHEYTRMPRICWSQTPHQTFTILSSCCPCHNK